MLRDVGGRPISLVRCPDGQGKPCFFQKHGAWLATAGLRAFQHPSDDEPFIVVDDLDSLLALVQMSTLEIHPWGSRVEDADRPDRLIWDLDPEAAVSWAAVIRAGQFLRHRLRELGIQTFARVTGGKGLHVVAPLRPTHGWETARAFARAVGELLVCEKPRRHTVKAALAGRKGEIYVDVMRNGSGATAIAPYSTRARPGAPVAVPVSWQELDDIPASDHFTLRDLPRRLAALADDPWAETDALNQTVNAENLRALGVDEAAG